MIPVTLASQSRVRSEILRNAGVTFDTCASGVDEDIAKASMLKLGASPLDIACALAEQKALAVSSRIPGMVIGADQTLELAGRLFDKPVNVEEARERLVLLRGRRHALHSAIVVANDGLVVWRDVQTAWLTMRSFTDVYLVAYLEQVGDRVLSSVGCYQLEGVGVQLFESIEGDYFTILGLPLFGLLEFLRSQGVLPE